MKSDTNGMSPRCLGQRCHLRDSIFLAALLTAALAAGVIAARASSAFLRWVIGRTLGMEW